VTTEISIYKGPGKRLRFDPIKLFLRSSCASTSHDEVIASADAWNKDDQIVFTPPCPAILWAGQMAESDYFVFSGARLAGGIEVSIFNRVCSFKLGRLTCQKCFLLPCSRHSELFESQTL